MPQDSTLLVKLYPEGDEDDAVQYEVEYVSFVNNGTFGPPPLVAPKDGNPPLAEIGDTVLYINTSRIGAFTIERLN